MSSPRQRAVLNPVSTLGGECNVPSCVWPCGVPTRNVTNEDNPGSGPQDPGDDRPGPRYPRGTPGGPRRGLHAVPDSERTPTCPKRPNAAGLAARAVTRGRLAAPVE